MGGHTKAVACISAEPAGNRLITGSLDYSIKIYDFGGMDRYDMWHSIFIFVDLFIYLSVFCFVP
jgi:WD40 repeat protein